MFAIHARGSGHGAVPTWLSSDSNLRSSARRSTSMLSAASSLTGYLKAAGLKPSSSSSSASSNSACSASSSVQRKEDSRAMRSEMRACGWGAGRAVREFGNGGLGLE